MLYISFQRSENTIDGVDAYFDYNYLDEWFDNDMVRKMILAVDKSEVKSASCIESPVLGQIPPAKLSGGVKALILMLMQPELEIYATSCGDNCAKWIVTISRMQDIKIVLRHLMNFDEDFEGFCLDTDTPIHTLDDYGRCAIRCL